MSFRPYSAIIAQAQASNTKLIFGMLNASGADIAFLQPVASDSGGRAKAVDPSSQSDMLKVLGVAATIIPNNGSGNVITHGKIENITTTFSWGDYVYVGKDGLLTNIIPEVGSNGFVEGDYIIRIGLIVRNKDVPANKDLVVQIERLGQL